MVRSGQSAMGVLRDQLSSAEERLAREMELRQSAELQRREAELQARGNLVTSQQLQERAAELTSQLQAEREAKAVQVIYINRPVPLKNCQLIYFTSNYCKNTNTIGTFWI